ncbi:hypothetical protein HYPSUDRAFT_63737 [Hypholoma sublateritium FD-334 SS-4]|uniref:Uncharacterized protein n=1 Tax=Hypholoma sublateritium (strain FD-334 SS-4) TaxID=945553 RepID=A0A0D2Q4B8_HYPSF|nr:hypothetical protein HYPSUDRAFT_63737 [Hypholoma sublateritium FD-334 SS-4]
MRPPTSRITSLSTGAPLRWHSAPSLPPRACGTAHAPFLPRVLLFANKLNFRRSLSAGAPPVPLRTTICINWSRVSLLDNTPMLRRTVSTALLTIIRGAQGIHVLRYIFFFYYKSRSRVSPRPFAIHPTWTVQPRSTTPVRVQTPTPHTDPASSPPALALRSLMQPAARTSQLMSPLLRRPCLRLSRASLSSARASTREHPPTRREPLR